MSARRADLAFAAALAICAVAIAVGGPLEQRLAMLGVDDFSRIWSGPRAFLAGADPYDAARWEATSLAIGALPAGTAVYAYPPWVVLVLLPFGPLDARAASVAWSLISVALAVIAVRAVLRTVLPGRAWMHATAAFALLLSSSGLVTLLTGQLTFVLIAAMAAVVLLLRAGRPVAAGCVAVTMLAKPQLFFLAAPALLAHSLWRTRTGRDARFLTASVLATVATVAVSTVLIPSWWPAWVVHVPGGQLGVQPITLPTLLEVSLGPSAVWLAAPILLAAVAAALCFHPRGDAWLPVWLALSSAATVYSNSYDQVFLVLPIMLAAGVAHRRSVRRAAVVMLCGTALLVLLGPVFHATDLRYAEVIPIGVFVLIVATLWPHRRATGAVDPAAGARLATEPPPAPLGRGP